MSYESQSAKQLENHDCAEFSPHNVLGDLIGELPNTGPAELLDDPAALCIVCPDGGVSVHAIYG